METLANKDLKNCIEQYKLRLKEILHRLEWSEDKVLKDFNSNSLASSAKKEIERSRSPIIASYPESCITKNSLVLETPQLQQVLQNNEVQAPRNFKELQVNFSREQKLKIYEHVIENTEKLESNIETQVAEGEISLADILAQKKREEKRKKRRFRKSKPTHIEEVRCLVDLQMEALQQFMGNKIKKEVDNNTGPGRSDKNEYGNNESYRAGDYYTKGNYRENRISYGEYYKRDNYRDRLTEQRSQKDRLKTEDFRSRPRSRSKEMESKYVTNGSKRHSQGDSKEFSYERNRRSRSINMDISYERRRHSGSRSSERKHKRSRSKERTQTRRSRSKEIVYRRHNRSRSKDGRSHSRDRKHKRSRSKERTGTRSSRSKDIVYQRSRHNRSRSKDGTKESRKYSRSRSKEISKERRKQRSISHSKDIYNEKRKHRSRSTSYERFSKGQKSDYYRKHSKARDYDDFKGKSYYREQYYRKQ